MSIDDLIDSMRTDVREHRWNIIEERAEKACRALDPTATAAIAHIDLTQYEEDLASRLRLAAAQLPSGARALYWEFDMDNDWSSAFFPCRSYALEANGDDEWASDFDDEAVLTGPDHPELAAQYVTSWDATAEIAARNAYLISRTIAAVGRAADMAWTGDVPLCAAYHDQHVVFRLSTPE